MSTLVRIGVVELAAGVLTGWLMVLASEERGRRRWGIVAPHRIRQGHIDLLMMGTILVAVGAAVDAPPLLAAVAIVAGSWIAPLLFFPLARWPQAGDAAVYKLLDRAGFVLLSAGWVVLAAHVLTA